jgi:hypothetical protein
LALLKPLEFFRQHKHVITDGRGKVQEVIGVVMIELLIARMSREITVLMQFLTPCIQALINDLVLVKLLYPRPQHQPVCLPLGMKVTANRLRSASCHRD